MRWWPFRRQDPVLDEEMPSGPNACRAPNCRDGWVELYNPATDDFELDICRVCHGSGLREQDSSTASRRK